MAEHYRPLAVVKSQLEMTQDFKDALWQRIISAKIRNQAKCLRLCGLPAEKHQQIAAFADEVLPGDPRNREAAAARPYFKYLFGGFSAGRTTM